MLHDVWRASVAQARTAYSVHLCRAIVGLPGLTQAAQTYSSSYLPLRQGRFASGRSFASALFASGFFFSFFLFFFFFARTATSLLSALQGALRQISHLPDEAAYTYAPGPGQSDPRPGLSPSSAHAPYGADVSADHGSNGHRMALARIGVYVFVASP